MSTNGRTIKRYLSSRAFVWWGLPVAITFAVWTTWMSLGYRWSNLLTVEFLIRLSVALVVIGVFGGRSFAAGMRRFGVPLEGESNGDHDRAG